MATGKAQGTLFDGVFNSKVNKAKLLYDKVNGSLVMQ